MVQPIKNTPNVFETEPPRIAEEYCPLEVVPDLEALVIEDGKPVENIFAEKQQRLLTEPLHTSWNPGVPFVALANVGLFFASRQPALVPDVMVSKKVRLGDDLELRENRSYYVWLLGKPPDAAIEIVSDRTGGEDAHKADRYIDAGVSYYVIFDPRNRLDKGILRAYALHEGAYVAVEPRWLPMLGLGLILWEGVFEGKHRTWLRWSDERGEVILTGAERAEKEKQRADRLAAQLRALGAEPEE